MGGFDDAGLSADVRVIFTPGTSADDRICACVEESGDPGRIICVTDDRELALACRHRGAEVWSVAQFVERGYREENRAARSSSVLKQREGEGKVISAHAAHKIDREMTQRWLRDK